HDAFPISSCNGLGPLDNLFQRGCPPLLIHCAKCASDIYLLRNNVCRTLSDNISKRQDSRLLRAGTSADNLLKGDNDMGSYKDRIHREVRCCRMPPFTDHPEIKFITACHIHTFSKTDLTNR